MNPGHRWFKIATPILSPTGGETAVSKPSFNGRPPRSGHNRHWGVNGWFHQWNHHHNNRCQTLDRLRKNRGSIGHPYTIPTTTATRTPETRRSTILKETGGGRTNSLAQDMPRVVHKNSLSEGIPNWRETNSLYQWHKRGISFNKN